MLIDNTGTGQPYITAQSDLGLHCLYDLIGKSYFCFAFASSKIQYCSS